jgi:hypothetical protein
VPTIFPSSAFRELRLVRDGPFEKNRSIVVKKKEVYTWGPFEEFSDIRVILFPYSPNLNTFERKNMESIRML